MEINLRKIFENYGYEVGDDGIARQTMKCPVKIDLKRIEGNVDDITGVLQSLKDNSETETDIWEYANETSNS